MAHQVRRAAVETNSRRRVEATSEPAKKSDIGRYHFDFNKTKSGLTRVSINEYKGKLTLDIRHYYYSADDGEYKPTPKGTGVPLHLAKSLATKVDRMLAAAAEAGVPGADGEE